MQCAYLWIINTHTRTMTRHKNETMNFVYRTLLLLLANESEVVHKHRELQTLRLIQTKKVKMWNKKNHINTKQKNVNVKCRSICKDIAFMWSVSPFFFSVVRSFFSLILCHACANSSKQHSTDMIYIFCFVLFVWLFLGAQTHATTTYKQNTRRTHIETETATVSEK